MSDKEFIHLIEKYLDGMCTPSEREKVEQWYDEYAAAHGDFDYHDDQQIRKIAERSLAAVKQKVLLKDLGHEEQDTRDTVKQRNLNFIHRLAAAVILLVSSVCTYLYFNPEADAPVVSSTQNQEPEDIQPGGNNAVLTLANGKKIVLNQAQEGLLAEEGNALVSKKSDGELIYRTDGLSSQIAEPQFNTLSTPRGGQYRIVLADGTKVWLNALSSLRFPACFSGDDRRVELEGEAYFEVANNKNKAFKVKMPNEAEVRVTGTHFNVMAYENENHMSTILLEGAVHVANPSGVVELKPGQQAILYKHTGIIKKSTADVEEAVAWKNGYFLFNNENIQSIMRKISRWYSVEVIYEGNMTGKDFSGTVSRYKNVSEVLNMLELTGIIHFKVKGRRISVMP